jgi:hypothetical protein
MSDDPGCYANTLAANDDGSTPEIGLPFSLNFFGVNYSSLWVNNNGNLTFDADMWDYTPWNIVTTGRPIIAPFFGDVDTRAYSGLTHYGNITYQGRPAFCATWADVDYGVNYYYAPGHNDRRNQFQAIIVNRDDRGEGDFDIVFNFDQIQWETGDASGGVGGLGGNSARVGYSNGNVATPWTSFELPGSAINGYFLDSAATGLIHNSRNSTTLGRYIFDVVNGAAPTDGTISGTVYDPSGLPVPGAPIEICMADDSGCVWFGMSNAAGDYVASGVPGGLYNIRAFPPSGSVAAPANLFGITHLDASRTEGQDLWFYTPVLPPPDQGIQPSRTGGGGVPSIYWNDWTTLTAYACPGALGSYQIVQGTNVIESGDMNETVAGSSGIYTGSVPPLYPNSGYATVEITFLCPGGSITTITFNIYIDPSGRVITPAGDPVEGAIVTLFRSDSGTEFEPVPNGSAMMSPSNRVNPMLSNNAGQFGWDVITGYYVVRAEREGCTAEDGSPYVETYVMEIPPPVMGLELVLVCDHDADDDGVPDDQDNCPDDANADQIDQDLDGLGDVCDDDLDGDGVDNDIDNCPDLENADQTDTDADGVGDGCDNDMDGDSVENGDDNCPLTVNVDQADTDGDGDGDACDTDDDDDGVLDGLDNCPVIWNEDQADFDLDGQGDECDGDDDGDGVLDEDDACPSSPGDVAINPEGCTGAQFISLMCGTRADHRNHGQYVSCVTHAANQARDEGLITNQEKAAFVRAAAQSR